MSDYVQLLGCVVLMVSAVYAFGRLMFDDDTPAKADPVPDDRDAHHIDFYGVEIRGKDK